MISCRIKIVLKEKVININIYNIFIIVKKSTWITIKLVISKSKKLYMKKTRATSIIYRR